MFETIMRPPISTFILSLLMVVTLVPAAHAADVSDLTFISEEFKPYNYTESGQARGLSVDLLKLIWRRMGVAEQPIQFLPWARGYEMTLKDNMTALFATARTPGREKLFKWAGPIVSSRIMLIARAGSSINLTSFEDAEGLRVGVVRNYGTENTLKKHDGFIKLVSVKSPKLNFGMLHEGRLDLIAIDWRTFKQLITKYDLEEADFKVALEYEKTGIFYAFSKDVPDELIARFQKALDDIRRTTTYRNLVNHYMD